VLCTLNTRKSKSWPQNEKFPQSQLLEQDLVELLLRLIFELLELMLQYSKEPKWPVVFGISTRSTELNID